MFSEYKKLGIVHHYGTESFFERTFFRAVTQVVIKSVDREFGVEYIYANQVNFDASAIVEKI